MAIGIGVDIEVVDEAAVEAGVEVGRGENEIGREKGKGSESVRGKRNEKKSASVNGNELVVSVRSAIVIHPTLSSIVIATVPCAKPFHSVSALLDMQQNEQQQSQRPPKLNVRNSQQIVACHRDYLRKI